jgi:uncharacterized protein
VISLSERVAVPAPPDRVWAVLSDPAAVVSCVSGAELGAAHEDGSFDGTLVVRFGAVRVRFAARVELALTESDMEGQLSARGKDGQAATRFTARATFRVAPDGADGSVVDLAGDVTLNGRLSGLVESGAGAVVARMTRDFTDKLIDRCAPPAAAPSPGAAAGPARPGRGVGLRARLRAWSARWWRRPLRRHRPVPLAEPAAVAERASVADEGGQA